MMLVANGTALMLVGLSFLVRGQGLKYICVPSPISDSSTK